MAVVRSAARPSLPDTNAGGSRYDRTTTYAAGQTSFGWLVGLYSLNLTSLAAASSFAESCGLGVSSKTSKPRSSSDE